MVYFRVSLLFETNLVRLNPLGSRSCITPTTTLFAIMKIINLIRSCKSGLILFRILLHYTQVYCLMLYLFKAHFVQQDESIFTKVWVCIIYSLMDKLGFVRSIKTFTWWNVALIFPMIANWDSRNLIKTPT